MSSFVQNIDKLELPNHLAAVVADPLLRKLLHLRPDVEAHQRVLNWVTSMLQDVESGEADPSTQVEFIGVLQEYAAEIKVCCPDP